MNFGMPAMLNRTWVSYAALAVVCCLYIRVAVVRLLQRIGVYSSWQPARRRSCFFAHGYQSPALVIDICRQISGISAQTPVSPERSDVQWRSQEMRRERRRSPDHREQRRPRGCHQQHHQWRSLRRQQHPVRRSVSISHSLQHTVLSGCREI